jgi:hypothetical protein
VLVARVVLLPGRYRVVGQSDVAALHGRGDRACCRTCSARVRTAPAAASSGSRSDEQRREQAPRTGAPARHTGFSSRRCRRSRAFRNGGRKSRQSRCSRRIPRCVAWPECGLNRGWRQGQIRPRSTPIDKKSRCGRIDEGPELARVLFALDGRDRQRRMARADARDVRIPDGAAAREADEVCGGRSTASSPCARYIRRRSHKRGAAPRRRRPPCTSTRRSRVSGGRGAPDERRRALDVLATRLWEIEPGASRRSSSATPDTSSRPSGTGSTAPTCERCRAGESAG